MSGFDPYLIWLDIPPHERPANYYRLFGLRPLEADANIIAAAAERVITHVSRYQQSENGAACNQLLDELTAARDCLLNPIRKQAYDSGFAQGTPGSAPIHQTPQIPNQAAGGHTPERQIAHSPPVPSSPANVGEQPLPSSVTPGTGAPAAQPVAGAPTGVPYSVQPTATPYGAPQAPAAGESPLPQSAYPQQAYHQPITNPTPTAPAQQPSAPTATPDPPANQPPAWAQGQPVGEVETVIAGQGATQPVSTGRTARGRQLRRDQQAQSAYLLVAIAMALVVFFFGAVLLLAIYMGGQ